MNSPRLALILMLLAVLCVGAVVGLLVGWPFGFAGGWYWWACGGVVAAVIGIAWFLWDMDRGANIIAGVTAAILLGAMLAPGQRAMAGEQLTEVPAQFQCKDGQLTAIRVIVDVPGPGVLTLQLPPDLCKQPAQETPTAPPQLPAPSTNPRRPTRST